MLLSSLAVLITALPLAVLGGEFPSYNGVPGGAPTNGPVRQKLTVTPPGDVVTKAGKLRYVENNGVCGEVPPLKLLPTCALTT